jgi:hypothetical protein
LSPEFSRTAVDNLETLRRLRPEATLSKALADSNSVVRVFAALIPARLGRDSGADVLLRAATAEDPKFGTVISRYNAMAALHMLGRPVSGAQT